MIIRGVQIILLCCVSHASRLETNKGPHPSEALVDKMQVFSNLFQQSLTTLFTCIIN